MKIPIYIIDTFTSEKFKGNPTSVFLLEKALDNETLHSVAKELSLPVTAFVETGNAENLAIRYFTVTGEIPACGHATLAAARVIFEIGAKASIKFETREKIVIEARSEGEVIFMTYPKFEAKICEVSKDTLESLGLSDFKSASFCQDLEALFVEVENPQTLRELTPDFKKMVESNDQIKEVVVTSVSDKPDFDYLLRSFCPWIGIDEDPVTGSVHTVLAGFWATRSGKNKLIAYQASERGGELYVTAFDDKVELGGKSVIILAGELTV